MPGNTTILQRVLITAGMILQHVTCMALCHISMTTLHIITQLCCISHDQLCYCIPRDFAAAFSSAGTPNVDYAVINQTINVGVAESSVGQRCFNFTVENDVAVEDPLECLVVRIQLPENASDLLRIAPGNDSTLCCIEDDDSELAISMFRHEYFFSSVCLK